MIVVLRDVVDRLRGLVQAVEHFVEQMGGKQIHAENGKEKQKHKGQRGQQKMGEKSRHADAGIGGQSVLIQFQSLPKLSTAKVLTVLKKLRVRLDDLRGKNTLPLRVKQQGAGGGLRAAEQPAQIGAQADHAHQLSGRGEDLAVEQVLFFRAAELCQFGNGFRQERIQPMPLADAVGSQKRAESRVIPVTFH